MADLTDSVSLYIRWNGGHCICQTQCCNCLPFCSGTLAGTRVEHCSENTRRSPVLHCPAHVLCKGIAVLH